MMVAVPPCGIFVTEGGVQCVQEAEGCLSLTRGSNGKTNGLQVLSGSFVLKMDIIWLIQLSSLILCL